MDWYLPVIWAALIGTTVALYVLLDGFDLGTRNANATSRAVLGRQRNLAHSGRRAVGRLPASLCGDHAGALPASHRHAGRAGIPRRRALRMPRSRIHA
jgi:hypothetical protein